MNESIDSQADDRDLPRFDRLEQLCSQFEAAWKTGKPPRMAEYIDAVTRDERTALLHELLGLDEYYRRQAGEEPTDAEYIAQHPEHAETIREYFAARMSTPLDVADDGAARRGLPAVPGYLVERELGRGGMGVVYLAMQVRPRRHVVLKMIRDGALAHPAAFRRFQTESEAIARLQHPNILHVYAVGEHEGRPYMALEYVAGGGLDRHLDGQPIVPGDAAHFIERLADAVHYAHEQGVIHRDLKPANVLLRSAIFKIQNEGQPPVERYAVSNLRSAIPKIADFGLAKLLEDEAGMLTMTGEALGTPSYMAPEQARGQTAEIGPATDVYALGAILYQLLTGRPPFVGPNAVTTLEQVTGLDPVPPRQLQPRVPRDLNTICLKSLEKSPRQRYPSAEALADDLRRFQAGKSIQAREVSVPERAVRWSRRYPAVTALIVTLIFGLAAMTGLAVRMLIAQRNEHLAKSQSDASLEQAQNAVRKALVFLAVDDEMSRKGLFELRLRVLTAITEQAETIRAQNDDKSLMARELAAAYLQIGTLQQQLGQLSKTATSLESAVSLYKMLAANDPEDTGIRIGLASSLVTRGNNSERDLQSKTAYADYKQAVAYLQHVIEEHPDELAAHQKLAEALFCCGELELKYRNPVSIEGFFQDALASAQNSLRIKPGDPIARILQVKCHLGLFENLVKQERLGAEAVNQLRSAGAILDLMSSAKPDDVSLRADIATNYLRLSKQAISCRLYSDVQPYLAWALDTYERLCLEFPTAQNYRFALASVHFRFGVLYRHLGRSADEGAARQKSIDNIEQLLKADPISVSIQTRSGIVSLIRYHVQYLIRINHLDEAMRYTDRAEEINEVVYGSDASKSLYDNRPLESVQNYIRSQHQLIRSLFVLDKATIFDSSGRYRESIAAWDQSIALNSSFTSHKQVGRCLALAGASDYEQALAQAKEVASKSDLMSEDWYDLARTYSRCCRAALTDQERNELGRTAVEFLTKAHALQFFNTPDAIELLTSDRNLEPLRGRADFAGLAQAVNQAKTTR